jgi:hypothetical protein
MPKFMSERCKAIWTYVELYLTDDRIAELLGDVPADDSRRLQPLVYL